MLPCVSSEHHDRFEALAVGHVLGGLDQHDSSEFRTHLVGCRRCRTHVAELRRLADELSQVEREERQRAATMLEVAEETDAEEPTRPSPWHRAGVRASVALLVLVVMVGLLFWNLHLRRVNSILETLATSRSEVIRILSEGDPLEVEAADGVGAAAARSGDEIALSVHGLPASGLNELLLVWSLRPDGYALDEDIVPAGAYGDGRLSLVVPARGVSEIVISMETVPLTRGLPAGDRLVKVAAD